MADQNIDIEVRAKALLGEAQKQISDFLKEVEEKSDTAGKKNATMFEGLRKFATDNEAAFKTAGVILTGVVGALGAVAAGVVALGAHGADVADIRAQFDVLNTSIGNNADTMLTKLRGATAGTITDFELMKSVNLGFSQGLKLSAGEMELTGKAARVLADRVGGDTKTAFDTLISAMATGKDMTLKTIGANIDGAAAVEKYAASIGKEAAELTEAEKKAAIKKATLEELTRVLQESGEAQVDFADAIAIAKTQLTNFTDGIAEGIANSPVLGAAISAVGKELSEAFGGSNQSLIDTIVKGIEFGAITMVEWGRTALTVSGVMIQAFGGVSTIINALLTAVMGIQTGFVMAISTIANLATKLPVVGDSFKGIASAADAASEKMKSVTGFFAENTKTAAAMTMGHSALHTTLDNIDGALGRVRDKMVTAGAAATEATSTNKTHATSIKGVTDATDDVAAAHQKATKALGSYTEEQGRAIFMSQNAAGAIFQYGMTLNKTSLVDLPLLKSSAIDGANGLYILQVASQNVVQEAQHMGPAWSGALGNLGNTLKTGLGPTIMSALTGGGDVSKSIGGLIGQGVFGPDTTKFLTSHATSMFGNLFGGAISSVIPGLGPLIGQLLGPVFGKVGDWFKGLFGADKKELEGRDAAKEFRDQLAGALSDTQKLEAGTNEWAKSVIKVRDAYMENGHTEQEALDVMDRLWKAEKQGGGAVAQVIAEITQNMGGLGKTSRDTTSTAASGFNSLTHATGTYNNSLLTTTKSAVVGFNEVQGQLRELQKTTADKKALQDLENAMMSAAAAGVTDFAWMADRINALKSGLSAPVSFSVTPVYTDVPRPTAGNWQNFPTNEGGRGPQDVIPFDVWIEDFVKRNGEEDRHRGIEAYGNVPGGANHSDQHDNNIPGSAGGGIYSKPSLRVLAETKPEMVGEPDMIVSAFMKALRAVPGGVAGVGGSTGGGTAPLHIHLELDGHEMAAFVIDTAQQGLSNGQLRVAKRNITDRIGRS